MNNEGNFKVRCVSVRDAEVNDMFCKKGDVFTFVNGRTTWNNGEMSCKYQDVDELNKENPALFKFELIPEPKQFTKADLRTGIRAEFRDGSKMVYVDTGELKGFVRGTQSLKLEWFDENFKFTYQSSSPEYDITKIFKSPDFLFETINPDVITPLLWQRPEPRKITKAEAEKILSDHLEETVQIEGVMV